MKIVLNKVEDNLRLIKAVRNDFNEYILALTIEFGREFLYEECKKYHVIPWVGDLVL
jgi:hypothetical protein